MSKPPIIKTPEEIYAEAVVTVTSSSGNLRPLTSCLMALRAAKQERVNNIEILALSSMIAYVGYTQGADQTTICEVLMAQYGIAEVRALPARLYQNATEFLADLEMKKIVN